MPIPSPRTKIDGSRAISSDRPRASPACSDFARARFAGRAEESRSRRRLGSAKTNRVAVAGSGQGLLSANWCASSTTASISVSMASSWADALASSFDDRSLEAGGSGSGLSRLRLRRGCGSEVAHALGVRPGAVGAAFEQRGPAAARARSTASAGGLVNGQDVVAVDVDSGHAITGAAAGHAGIAGRVGERHFGRELVVLADEQHRQLPDAGHVKPFVEGAVVDGAVAEEGDGHLIGLHQLETVSGAGGLQDARTDDAARAHHADFGGEQVHAAAAPLRTAGRAAEQFGEQLAGRNTLGQRMPVSAVRAEDDVIAAQMGTNAGGNRLLSHVSMTRTMNQPALMRTRQLLFATADQNHCTIE